MFPGPGVAVVGMSLFSKGCSAPGDPTTVFYLDQEWNFTLWSTTGTPGSVAGADRGHPAASPIAPGLTPKSQDLGEIHE